MNDSAVLEPGPATDPGRVEPMSGLHGGGYELFGLGWRPRSLPSEYVGRHRSPDA